MKRWIWLYLILICPVSVSAARLETKSAGGGGGSGTVDDDVTVNSTSVDTTANLLDNTAIEWTLTDGGAGGPDDITADIVNDSIDGTELADTITLDADLTLSGANLILGGFLNFNNLASIHAEGSAGKEVSYWKVGNNFGITLIPNGNVVLNQYGTCAQLGTLNGYVYCNPASTVASSSGGWTDDGTVVRLDTSTDDVAIGTASSSGKLTIDGDSDEVQLYLKGGATQTSDILQIAQDGGGNILSLSNDSIAKLVYAGAIGSEPKFWLRKASGTLDSPGNVADDEDLGNFYGWGYHTGSYIEAAGIEFEVDGTPGASDMPGRIRFLTTKDGAAATTTAMLILSNQHVTINSSGTDLGALTVGGGDDIVQIYARAGAAQSSEPVLEVATVSDVTAFSAEVNGTTNIGSTGMDGTLKIHDDDAGGDASISIQAPDALGTGYTLTLPPNDGNSGDRLRTDGSGVTTWIGTDIGTVSGSLTIDSGTYTSSIHCEDTANGNTCYWKDSSGNIVFQWDENGNILFPQQSEGFQYVDAFGNALSKYGNVCPSGQFSTLKPGGFDCQTPAGGGNVSASGTPTAGYIATWSDATTIQEGAVKLGTMTDTKFCIYDSASDSIVCNSNSGSDATARQAAFGITIDGGGSAITTGVKGYQEIPYAMTITGWTFLCDQSGSIVVDVWKDTYANYPPTVADTIAGSEKPTVSAALKGQDLSLSTWTTSVTEGDVVGFNVDSASTVTRCSLTIQGDKT